MCRPANAAQADNNATSSDGVTEIDFMFPIVPGVNDGLIQVMNGMVDQFNSVNPHIVVTPIYSGSYVDTLRRVIERVEAGNPPAVVRENCCCFVVLREYLMSLQLLNNNHALDALNFVQFFSHMSYRL
jgi:sn-glycerol 3-phosphate transport system substrate-binding protein